MPSTEASWLSFSPGPRAEGSIESDCSFIAFGYTYDPDGSSIRIRAHAEGDGSYAEDCSAGAMAQYTAVGTLLPRIAQWRMPQADRLELLEDGGALLLLGGPLPPLPTPPPGGECGSVAVALCEEAATQAFNFGLFLTPGQRVLAWRVRDTINTTACPDASTPRFDVIFELENPTFEKVVTVGDLYGKLHACGDY